MLDFVWYIVNKKIICIKVEKRLQTQEVRDEKNRGKYVV